MNLIMALCAPLVGALASRKTLWNLMILGMAMMTGGFLLLAFSASYPVYILVYAVLMGPGMTRRTLDWLSTSLSNGMSREMLRRSLGVEVAMVFLHDGQPGDSLSTLTPPVRSFTERTLVKACKALVKAGFADAATLEPAPRLPPDTRVARLVADRICTHPDSSLRDIATWLSRDLREPTPRGGLAWAPEGIRRETRAKRGLLQQ